MPVSRVEVLIDAKDRASKVLRKFNKNLSGLEPTLKKMALIGTASFAAISVGVFKATQSAVKAQEIFNKFDVVFQDVSDQADAVAKNLTENFGLAESSAKDLLSATGDMLTGFGLSGKSALDLSKKVNELAVDLASFTNFSGGAAGASRALTKALLGERESVKELGIAILESDVKAKVIALAIAGKFTTETNRERRAIATLEIAIEQSANAIGDYARTSQSAANLQRTLGEKTKELTETFGGLFEPILQKVLKVMILLVKEIKRIIEENPRLTKTIFALAFALTGLVAIAGIAGLTMLALSTAIGGAALGMVALLGPVVAATVVLSLLASVISDKLNSAYDESTKASDALAKKSGELANKLKDLRQPIRANSDEMKRLAEETKEASDKVEGIQKTINNVIKNFNDRRKSLNRQTAEEIIKQEENIALLIKELEEEKTRESSSQNKERIADLKATIEIETEALRSKASLEASLENEVLEARRRSSLTAFERRIEDLQREKIAERVRFNEKIALLREELAEQTKILNERKEGEKSLTEAIVVQNELRREEYRKTVEEARKATDEIIAQSERINKQTQGIFGRAFSSLLSFQSGGTVPGPIGSPQLAVVHGGERITPVNRIRNAGGGGITINITGNNISSDLDMATLAERVGDEVMRALRFNQNISV